MVHISLYFLALLSLSTSPNWAKLNHMPPEMLGFYRMLGASLILGLFFLIKKQKPRYPNKSAFYWNIGSATFFFLHLWTYKYAAKNTLVANTMILFATNPIWASLGGQLFFKESIKPRVILSYILAVIGVFIMVSQNLNLTSENHIGNVSALVSAFFYAGYMLMSKKARTHITNENFSFLLYSTTAFLFLITTLISIGPSFEAFTSYDRISWLAILGLILFPTFLGHFSFTYLVKYMPLGFMTCGKLIEPILASIFAYFLFNEQLGTNTIYAFLLTVASVVILFWPTLIAKRSN